MYGQVLHSVCTPISNVLLIAGLNCPFTVAAETRRVVSNEWKSIIEMIEEPSHTRPLPALLSCSCQTSLVFAELLQDILYELDQTKILNQYREYSGSQRYERRIPGYVVSGQKDTRANLAMASKNEHIVPWPSRPLHFIRKRRQVSSLPVLYLVELPLLGPRCLGSGRSGAEVSCSTMFIRGGGRNRLSVGAESWLVGDSGLQPWRSGS